MPDAKFLKPWHGIPRERITWNPTVHDDACIGCGTCVTGCSRLVYRYDFERQKATVADPLNCMVDCTTCANTCPASAISFPPLESVLRLENLPDVHHAIEDDLVARRKQLEAERTLPSPERHVNMVVTSIRDEGNRTRILTLGPKTPGDCFCVFVPGQYVELLLPDSQWLGRAYSIGNAPRSDGSIELQIRRTPEGRLTTWVFDRMRVGDDVTARGPMGGFTMRSPPEVPLVFVAAGTAFAPIKALIEQQLALFPKRDIVLVWGSQRATDLYELEVLESWVGRGVHVTLSLVERTEGDQIRLPVVPGTVADAVRACGDELRGRDAYLAGGRDAIVAARAALVERGIALDHVFVDSFGG